MVRMARLDRDYHAAAQAAGAVQEARRRLLWVLVLLAAAVLAVGSALYLWQVGMQPPLWRIFVGVPRGLHTPQSIVELAAHGNSRALVDAGTLALVAAPVLQLVLAVWIFARRRDVLYAGFSLLVLALLLSGLGLGWL
ncbi:hypothetical protein B1806_00435 [Metallibacterium scheffleri]|uniref:DUF1634 domain-containing protein n=2 Tax=Metallibacterium scheffleri TaxID=993689 RepID=A0A4S3KSN2_9GAMM|nr:hypothetical protein B1806_00435 [Metallibacterium scheffleri]